MKKSGSIRLKEWISHQVQMEVEPEIERLIELENIRFLAAATLAVAITELLFLLISLLVPAGANRGAINTLFCAAACILASFLARRHVKRGERSGRPSRWAFPVIAAFYLLMSFLSAWSDVRRYRAGEQMLFFFIVQFCFMLFVNFKPLRGLLLATASFAWLCIQVIAADGGEHFNFSSFVLLYVLAVLGNAIKYCTRVTRHREKRTLELQKEENEIVMAQSGKYVVRFDLKHNILYNAPEADEMFGLPLRQPDPLAKLPHMDFILPESREHVLQVFGDMVRGVPRGSGDFHLRMRDGTEIWQHCDYTLQADQTGAYVCSIISYSDVTEQMEQQRIHEKRIRDVVSLTRDCDSYVECSVERWTVDAVHLVSGKMGDALPAVGQDVDEVIETKWKPIVHMDDYSRFREFFSKSRLQLLNANGVSVDRIEFRLVLGERIKWYGIDICLLQAIRPRELRFFVILRDIDAAHALADPAASQITQDALTGLNNRDTTLQLIGAYLSGDGAPGTHALLTIDVDDLKKLNDAFGHQAGDELLRKVGECFRDTFRQSDICGRMGGDEFFVLIKSIGIDKVVCKVKRLLSRLQVAFSNNGEQIITSVSVGIAMYHGDITPRKTIKMLYAEADAALYKSKAMGKNTYTFADELDALAAGSASPALLQNDLISYNLRGLLDNLANGIAIFHGTANGGVMPMFCNEKLTELLGITQERFFTHMAADNSYAVHPEDRERARTTLEETVQSGGSAREVFRLLTGSGGYRYVTVFLNTHYLDDGSFDLYCIFSDAEEAEQLRRIQESSHRRFQKKWMQVSEGHTAYILLNITNNSCGESCFAQIPEFPIDSASTVEVFLAGIGRNIASDKLRADFLARFALDTYEKDMDEGVYHKEMRLPLLRKGYGVHWYQMNTELSYNPDTGDIEAFAAFADIDSVVRLGYVVDRMLDSEYEYLCQIDVQSGSVKRIGRNDDDHSKDDEAGRARYAELYRERLQSLLPEEYWEESARALSLERIIRELADKDTYTCVFPVLREDGQGERLCQWSCEYVGSMQSTVLLSRKDISRFLDYGYDSLTGLLARSGFYQSVRNELNTGADHGDCCLMELDFDGFKLLNEEQGYSEGNRFLRQFATDLRKQITKLDERACIGRFEADHFLLFLRRKTGVTPEEIYAEIARLVSLYPEAYRLGLRMGVYQVTDTGVDVALMCDCAHLAHKASKGRFSRTLEYYSGELRDKMLDEQLLASEMQNALETEQFEVWFQPQVDHAAQGSLIGAEALVRWRHPVRGLVSPALFIPLFEQNGFIWELDKYVWRCACRQLRRWLDAGVRPLPISVNVSRMDIQQADFLDTLFSIVEEQQIPCELLHLEVTESAFTENAGKVVEAVKALIARGFTVAIDDFGSGYSSLSMLKSVPAQVLKLDMRFFSEEGETLRNECIIESVVRMGKMLGMAVLAEGVERVEQADFLRSVGCSYIQGYLYAKPMCLEEYAAYAEKAACEVSADQAEHALTGAGGEQRGSYELFRSIISGSNDIILVADIQTNRLLYANQAAERYYGRNFDPMHPITCSQYCGEQDLCKDCPVQGLEKGQRKERVYSENGSHMKALYTRMEWNGHDAFVSYQTDISAELRELELAEALIRNIPGAMILFGLNGEGEPEIRYVSKQALAVFRQTGLKGRKPSYADALQAVHPEDRARVQAAAAAAFRDKRRFREEFRIRTLSGAEHWVELTTNPVADSNGTYQFYGIYTDITDRRNAQARADALIQSIPTAMTIYEIGREGMRRVFISDNAKRILHASEDTHEKVDMDVIYRRIHPADEQRVRDITGASILERKPFSIQFRLKEENDASRWVQLDSTPIPGKEDSVLYYSIFTDISAQKQIELHGQEKDLLRNAQELVNLGLQEALRQPTSEQAIAYTLAFVGKAFQGERAYIFEKNPDGSDSNTYEWVAEGIVPEQANLQNVPGEVSQPWYQQFRENGILLLFDVESIRQTQPRIYAMLQAQGIHTLMAAPFFNDQGEAMGFFGLDNPPAESLQHHAALVQTIAYFIEAALKRSRLEQKQS